MGKYLIEKRARVIFPTSGSAFRDNCTAVRLELKQDAMTDVNAREAAAQAAADLAIDLKSFLINWKLLPSAREGLFSTADINTESDSFLALARELGDDGVIQKALAEIESIRNSTIRKMSEMQLDGEINTVWGHDYASGIAHSLRRGAVFSTNNPAKNTLFKKDFPGEYEAILNEIVNEWPNASLDDKVSMILVKICARNARQLRPIYDLTDGKYGFICIQVNPFNIPNPDSTEKIIRQVEFYDAAFRRELGTDHPNIVYKIPAVERALDAAEYLAGKGYRLCVTLNFTVGQHEAFAKIISASGTPGFVVLMGGLLDDKVGADLKALGIENAAEIARHAAQAVIRKSYGNLHAKGYDQMVSIMTAAVRGPWAIANTLAPVGGAESYITTLTAKINEFDQSPLPIVAQMDVPLDEGIMSVLMQSPVFRLAYATLDEQPWNWDALFDFPPFVAFYDQFRDAYAVLTEDMRKLTQQAEATVS